MPDVITVVSGVNQKLSVAIACFNGSKYLRQQLDSILNQERQVQEIVVSDDFSADNTRCILEEYRKEHPKLIRLIYQNKNVGVLNNFFEAFKACTGDIIFYCDQDDVWMPDKVSRVVSKFNSPSTAIVAHTSLIVDENLVGGQRIPKRIRFGSKRFPYYPTRLICHGHQIAFTREVRDLILNLYPHASRILPSHANNLDLYIPFCASLVGDGYIMPNALVKFRRHSLTVSPLGKPSSLEDGKSTGKINRLEMELRHQKEIVRAVKVASEKGLLSEEKADRVLRAYNDELRLLQIGANDSFKAWVAFVLFFSSLGRKKNSNFGDYRFIDDISRILRYLLGR